MDDMAFVAIGIPQIGAVVSVPIMWPKPGRTLIGTARSKTRRICGIHCGW